MNLMEDQIIELKTIVNSTIGSLYRYDISLMERRANERSIAFRFGLYFNETIRASSFAQDPDLTIDFDYNRNLDNVKNMHGFNDRHGVYPDIILHHRGFNDKNIFVIEFKGIWNRNVDDRKRDFTKLIEFTHPDRNDYQYGLGVFIDLGYDFDGCRFTYFLNGEQA
jgi:hypothetical protein